MSRAVPLSLVCARCGRRASWSHRRGRYVHAGGGPVAACDLDAEHRAEPDWEAVGEVPCATCAGPVAAAGAAFSHVVPGLDADHAADPGFPVAGDG